MTLLLKQIFGLLKLLNSDTGTNQIAAGIAAGFILGMTPGLSLQSLVIFICLFIFRIQIGAAFLSSFFFAFIAWILDPIFHSVGVTVLEMKALEGLFTTLYNMPILPFTRFNNSLVLGSGIVAFILAPFIFIVSKSMVKKYRKVVVERFKETKFWKVMQSTALFKWYYKYDKLRG